MTHDEVLAALALAGARTAEQHVAESREIDYAFAAGRLKEWVTKQYERILADSTAERQRQGEAVELSLAPRA